MTGRTKEGWMVIIDDHSRWSHSDLVVKDGRIEVELADLGTQALIRKYLAPGSAVIDCGAHLGCFTIPMMRAVGPQGLVVAFEPDRDLYECLSANVEKELTDQKWPWAMAFLYRGAIGERCGAIKFLRNPDNWGAGHVDFTRHENALPNPQKGVWDMVSYQTLDSCRELFGGRAPISFIKIDVEGSEIDVLRGGRYLIELHRPVMLIETQREAFQQRGITLATIEEELAAMNYRFEFFPPHWVEAGKQPHDILAFPL